MGQIISPSKTVENGTDYVAVFQVDLRGNFPVVILKSKRSLKPTVERDTMMREYIEAEYQKRNN